MSINKEVLGESEFLVCIQCMTYNQSAYITDAMNGFTMQQTKFPFVAVIIDDASTDGEQEVINAYIDEHFTHSEETSFKQWETEDAFWTFACHKENENCHFVAVYLKRNLFKEPKKKEAVVKDWFKAKYTALCEGDDYWIDPLKLQKQVDYLEEHDDCIMCTHSANWAMKGEMLVLGCQYETERDLTTDEVIRYGGLYLATCSLVFRKELADDWPTWRKLADVGDYPLQILGTIRGEVHFSPNIMCVYRFQQEGSWTYKKKQTFDIGHIRNEINWLELLDKETHYLYTEAINFAIFPYYAALYRRREVSFGKYWRSAKLSHHFFFSKKMFKDLFYRNLNPIYRLLKNRT